MAVVGEKEMASKSLSIRSRLVGDLGEYDTISALGFIETAVKDNVELHEVQGVSVVPRAAPRDEE